MQPKFIIFRHGHSLANQESRIVSSHENGIRTTGGPEGTGFGLSKKGILEVAESARSLAEHIFASTQPGQHATIRILTSPFQRTLQTAGIIDYELRKAIEHHHSSLLPSKDTAAVPMVQMDGENEPNQVMDLRERFFGDFEMRTPSDDLYAKVWREDALNPFHEKFQVESVAMVTKRMTDVIRFIETMDKERGCKAEDSSRTTDQQNSWVIIVSHGDSLQILQTAMRGWSGDRHRQLEHLNTAEWRHVAWCEALADAHR
ncbi:hypothetical protein BG011_006319 [Mortierella polycephala]|uniref:Phosphoglycerate mutase-like protein n=1 Tax=Mortierella polycephala TaxID=41804 RepID=A0A9P6PWF4_9FUNG|nr:hypothetical protein BG011_006319 [Mortierella polycephala]